MTVLINFGEERWALGFGRNTEDCVARISKVLAHEKGYRFYFLGNFIFFKGEFMAILWPFWPFCISFFPCALGWQQNSQEQCDEDTLDWKKKKRAVCCMSSSFIREKENLLTAMELHG